jgi:hypothetical protein
MFGPERGNTFRRREVYPQEKCMNKSASQLFTLAMFAIASFVIPLVAPTKAVAETTKAAKKHRKTTSENGQQMRAPTTSSQYPPNMADDPNRKISY